MVCLTLCLTFFTMYKEQPSLKQEKMSYQEKKSIVSLISSLLIFGSYCVYVYQAQGGGNPDVEDPRFWASAILVLIPVSIAAKIVISIFFSIVYKIATNEAEPSFSDELDKLIGLKAVRASHYVFVLGFLLALLALVLHQPLSVMFIVLALAGFLSEVAGLLTQLYLYRKGV